MIFTNHGVFLRSVDEWHIDRLLMTFGRSWFDSSRSVPICVCINFIISYNFRMSNLSVFETCVKITSAFEGTSYGTVTGNFDGQGISLGILQWNLGQGTLQSHILNFVNWQNFHFPFSIKPLYSMTPAQAVQWASDTMMDDKGRLTKEWESAWRDFANHPSVIETQKQAVSKYFHRAKEICGKLNFTHDNKRAMAWAFDVAVQNWSLNIDEPQPNQDQAKIISEMYDSANRAIWIEMRISPEMAKLIIASHMRALKSKVEWRQDVFIRKATIAFGRGIVHGKRYDFTDLF